MASGTVRLWVWVLEALMLFAQATWALPTDQVPLSPVVVVEEQVDSLLPQAPKHRPLHGRFLHVTDFHPDRFYQVYSSTAEESACHRGQGPAGIYGAETSECDSPFALVNKTFEWISDEFRDNIDFVVWTGDSARHDNDENIPRNAEQVTGLNEFMVHKMLEVFGKKDGEERDGNPNNDYIIPIVPNLGNNDVLPHNIMTKGPNKWTRTYASLWKQFIPEVQRHSFEQGGWFSVEVIPGKLAVFSLNTLYFFTSNAAVDGCAAKSEPGYRQMEWLRIQLQLMRTRGMKAILIGHVPPARTETKSQWDETCWQKYALWLQQYRDVIIVGLWGHMNYDHFFFQDFKDIDDDTNNGRMRKLDAEDMHSLHADDDNDNDVHAALSSNYFVDLREQWAKLPKPPKHMDWIAAEAAKELMQNSDDQRPEWEVEELVSMLKKGKSKKKKEKQKQKKFLEKVGGEWAERFAVSFTGASVVPNLLPVVRVFEYNISGLDGQQAFGAPETSLDPGQGRSLAFESLWREGDDELSQDGSRWAIARKKKAKPVKFIVPDPPSKSAPPGPAYSPQTLSLLGYTQYLANLTRINNDFTAAGLESETDADEAGIAKWNEGKHKNKKPHDRDHTPKPKKFKFDLHYDTRNDSVYQLQDLTIKNMLDLAQRIGAFVPEHSKANLQSDEPEDLDEEAKEQNNFQEIAKNKKKKKHKGKKGKHGKHGKKHRQHKHSKENEAWYTFIRRAFVETIGPDEIEEEFGD